MKNQKVNKTNKRKSYLLWTLFIILGISIFGVWGATNYIDQSGLRTTTVNATNLNINDGKGNASILNISGIYINNNKAFSRTADVVVCRGTSVIDDLIKSFTCDVVCKSDDDDCKEELQLGLNQSDKTIRVSGNYHINATSGASILITSINTIIDGNLRVTKEIEGNIVSNNIILNNKDLQRILNNKMDNSTINIMFEIK